MIRVMTEIPDWVKDALQRKLDECDYGNVNFGSYCMYVEREHEDEEIEEWCGCVPVGVLDDWYGGECDPTMMRDDPTIDILNIYPI